LDAGYSLYFTMGRKMPPKLPLPGGSKTSPNTWFLGPRFRVRIDVAKFFYSNRVFNELNMLSEEIIAGNSLSGFIR